MNGKQFVQNLEMLGVEEECKFLIKLTFNLTVVARNTYTAGKDEVDRPKALRGIVEIIHKSIARAQSLSSGLFNVAATDFGEVIFGIACTYGCLFELENAIAFSN